MSDQASREPVEYRQYRFALPNGAADVLLIRHGESAPAREDEPAVLTDGQSDPDLDPVGAEQARCLADRLEREPLAAVYVTSLRRTAQTAAPLAERLGLTPRVEPDLREVFLGEWEGAAFRKHTSELHPVALKMATEQRWDAIPGAESTEHFQARVRRGLARIAAAHPDQRVAVVTHGGVIGMVMAMATGSQNFAFVASDNGSISQVVVHGDNWLVRRYNDTAHLESLSL